MSPRYTAYVTRDDDDPKWFIIRVPDLPWVGGLIQDGVTQAQTPGECVGTAADLVESVTGSAEFHLVMDYSAVTDEPGVISTVFPVSEKGDKSLNDILGGIGPNGEMHPPFVVIHVNDAQYEAFEKVARQEGKDIDVWARDVCLAATRAWEMS